MTPAKATSGPKQSEVFVLPPMTQRARTMKMPAARASEAGTRLEIESFPRRTATVSAVPKSASTIGNHASTSMPRHAIRIEMPLMTLPLSNSTQDRNSEQSRATDAIADRRTELSFFISDHFARSS